MVVRLHPHIAKRGEQGALVGWNGVHELMSEELKKMALAYSVSTGQHREWWYVIPFHGANRLVCSVCLRRDANT
jgi:hypothetical protein